MPMVQAIRVFVKYLTAADILDSRQQDMAADKQVSRDRQRQLDSHGRNEQTGNEQPLHR